MRDLHLHRKKVNVINAQTYFTTVKILFKKFTLFTKINDGLSSEHKAHNNWAQTAA